MLYKIKIPKATDKTKIGLLFIIIIGCFISNIFSYYNLIEEYTKINYALEDELKNTSLFQKQLAYERNKNQSLTDNLKNEKENNDKITAQIETISSSVGVLEKLSKTDSELLKKYSKIYFLNENYRPQKLTEINREYLFQKERKTQIHTDVWPHLQKMMDDASSTGLSLLIVSAYRSFGEQASLKSTYLVSYGSGANKFSADQGYSEHQLGTTVDFTNYKNGANLKGFDATQEYRWLLTNAYKYGFIISYPKENKYYIFEPWHWRYVGIDLANRIQKDGTFFYSLDQRDIDGYLVNLF